MMKTQMMQVVVVAAADVLKMTRMMKVFRSTSSSMWLLHTKRTQQSSFSQAALL